MGASGVKLFGRASKEIGAEADFKVGPKYASSTTMYMDQQLSDSKNYVTAASSTLICIEIIFQITIGRINAHCSDLYEFSCESDLRQDKERHKNIVGSEKRLTQNYFVILRYR
jgi:hypothetical protein